MTIGFLFWLIMVLWFFLGIFGLGAHFPADGPGRLRFGFLGGSALILFVLLFLLGWQAFGFVIRGPGGP